MQTVHLIRQWSGRREDETPLCGADTPRVWQDRTIYRAVANCGACLERARLEGLPDLPPPESWRLANRF